MATGSTDSRDYTCRFGFYASKPNFVPRQDKSTSDQRITWGCRVSLTRAGANGSPWFQMTRPRPEEETGELWSLEGISPTPPPPITSCSLITAALSFMWFWLQFWFFVLKPAMAFTILLPDTYQTWLRRRSAEECELAAGKCYTGPRRPVATAQVQRFQGNTFTFEQQFD